MTKEMKMSIMDIECLPIFVYPLPTSNPKLTPSMTNKIAPNPCTPKFATRHEYPNININIDIKITSIYVFLNVPRLSIDFQRNAVTVTPMEAYPVVPGCSTFSV
jgi:hypothetical protein